MQTDIFSYMQEIDNKPDQAEAPAPVQIRFLGSPIMRRHKNNCRFIESAIDDFCRNDLEGIKIFDSELFTNNFKMWEDLYNGIATDEQAEQIIFMASDKASKELGESFILIWNSEEI